MYSFTVINIFKIESVQRLFTKRISSVGYRICLRGTDLRFQTWTRWSAGVLLYTDTVMKIVHNLVEVDRNALMTVNFFICL